MSYSNRHIFTNSELKGSLTYLMEFGDVESDVGSDVGSYIKNDVEDDIEDDLTDLKDNFSDLTDIVDDNVGRMDYVRQLTGEFLELLMKLTSELDDGDVEIPETLELMTKMMGRKHRKRYYMSKFRL